MSRDLYLAQNAPRLVQRMRVLSDTSPFYRRLLKRMHKELRSEVVPDPAQIVEKTPFTIKDDLRRAFPKGFLAADWTEIRAYYESSGTTDGSIRSSRSMALRTRSDLDRDMQRRIPPFLGDGAGRVALVNLPYALTSSAVGFHEALSRAGFIVVAGDQGQVLSSFTRIADLVQALDVRVLVTSDPLLLRDVTLFDTGVDIFKSSKLEWILTVGVPISSARRKWIKEEFGIAVLSYYGLSEFGAVGVPDQEGGMYVHEDFYVEIFNPKDRNARAGEIVVWDLQSEGSPLIRYQTGDIGRVEFREDVNGRQRVYLEVVGRMKELIFDGKRFLLPVDFQEMLVGLPTISPIHKVSVEGEKELAIKLDVQAYSRSGEEDIEELKRRASQLTSLPIEIRSHKFGELFAGVYNQEFYRNAQTAKSMSFHDKRRGDWIVTY